MVQSVGADGKVQVYFVDYGNNSTVEATHLRTIEPRLLTLPFLAIRCWLAGMGLCWWARLKQIHMK